MGLTLEVEQKLIDVQLVDLFNNEKSEWVGLATKSLDFVSKTFPEDATIRRDDVAKALVPVLAVNDDLRDHLSNKKLRQKFWFKDFADLIMDRCWADIHKKGAK
jgi:hypothetical protein